jgi:hypothetical protein
VSPVLSPATQPKIDEHRARKDYRCDDPSSTGCTRTVVACPIGAGGDTCLLAEGHDGPHDYPATLF